MTRGAQLVPTASHLLGNIGRRTGALLSLQIEITSACPLRCVHCYNDRTVAARLSRELLRRVFAEAADLGCLFLALTGGEIFVRPDLFEIVADARQLRFDVRLLTSGWYVTSHVAAQLRELNVSEVHVSLFSDDPAVHDCVTGTAGSHERALAAVGALRECGVRVVLKTVVTSLNASSYQGVALLARQLGCSHVLDQTVVADEARTGSSCRVRPSTATLRAANAARGSEYVEQLRDMRRVRLAEHPDDGRPCLAGERSLFVASDGNVLPCALLGISCGNVIDEPLARIWRDSKVLARVRGLRWSDLSECANCELRSVCSHCIASSLNERGNPLAPAPEDCRQARLRKELLANDGLIATDDLAGEGDTAIVRGGASGRRRDAAG